MIENAHVMMSTSFADCYHLATTFERLFSRLTALPNNVIKNCVSKGFIIYILCKWPKLQLAGQSLERIPLPKPKNSKIKNLILEKLNTLTTLPYGIVLKNLNMSPFAVAYHSLDGILNLCTKFEVLSFTKSSPNKERVRVPKYKRCTWPWQVPLWGYFIICCKVLVMVILYTKLECLHYNAQSFLSLTNSCWRTPSHQAMVAGPWLGWWPDITSRSESPFSSKAG